MVLPITIKPPRQEEVLSSLHNAWFARTIYYFGTQERYSQVQPWDRPLPYYSQKAVEISAKRHSITAIEIPGVGLKKPYNFGSLYALAYERAYNKLSKAVHSGGRGELGITLAQTQLTYKLYKDYLHKFVYMQKIADICETLDRFAVFTRRAGETANRKERLKYRRKAARVLGVRAPSDREVRKRLDGAALRTGITSFSAEYLAVHYGWSPLFEEIYQNLKFLSEGINYPKGFYQESGSSRFAIANTPFPLKEHKGRVVVKLGAVAEVESELAYCLGVLGLANPAAIVWDAVKWSFVVDWVLSIGPRLQNQTNWLGIKFSNSYQTTYYSCQYTGHVPGPDGYTQQAECCETERKTNVGFVPPPIRVKNPIGRDWGKAFSQISLLALFGLKHKKPL